MCSFLLRRASVFLLTFAVILHPGQIWAQGTTSFSYQGQLSADGIPVRGSFDLQFSIFDAAAGGNQLGLTLTNPAVTVSNGMFSTSMDFGSNVFIGQAAWLQIGVRPAGLDSAFYMMAPRQPALPVPYALYAMTPAGPQGPSGPPGPQGPPGPAGSSGGGTGTSIPNIVDFETNGVFSPPAGESNVIVELWGAGGGGGAGISYGSYPSTLESGGGGGGGGYTKAIVPVIPGSNYVVTIGLGGAGSGSPNGGAYGANGGSSSFGSLISVAGGFGGQDAFTNHNSPFPGVGGPGGPSAGTGQTYSIAVQGMVNIDGGNGQDAIGLYLVPGGNGGAGWSGGALSLATNQVVNSGSGTVPGGGGGGGSNFRYFTGIGGNGANGRVVVYY